jgi:hypothetical protein
MTERIKRAARNVIAAAALGVSCAASATSFSTNYSDLWWNATESGWGLNVSQQADTMFLTLFVYGQNASPVWYSATLQFLGDGINGQKSFSGDLYATTGPWFGGAFNPSQVALRKVGTITFASNNVTSAVLQYSVDGTIVTKNIQRQTLVNNNLGGTYLGTTQDLTSNCANNADNGTRTSDVGTITVTHTGTSVTIQAPTCTYTGVYGQDGQAGTVAGTYTCTNGASGSVTFYDLRTEVSGLLGRYTGQDASCSFNGNIAALRKP